MHTHCQPREAVGACNNSAEHSGHRSEQDCFWRRHGEGQQPRDDATMSRTFAVPLQASGAPCHCRAQRSRRTLPAVASFPTRCRSPFRARRCCCDRPGRSRSCPVALRCSSHIQCGLAAYECQANAAAKSDDRVTYELGQLLATLLGLVWWRSMLSIRSCMPGFSSALVLG